MTTAQECGACEQEITDDLYGCTGKAGWSVNNKGGSLVASALIASDPDTSYSALMFERNSPFDRVLPSLSMSSSIASTGDSGFKTLRRTQMRARSSLGMSNSSL